MKRIGLLSDTHGYLDERVFKYFAEVDEIWHAGDIGDINLTDKLAAFKPLRAVYGNIDGASARRQFPEHQIFELEGLRVWMTHIGGFPGRYPSAILEKIKQIRPKLFVCGHSHIVRIMPDKKWNLLHINPGAAGIYGFHQIRTLVRFGIENGKIVDLQLIELGPRSSAQFVESSVETT
jgi:putative phosphoesterase